MPIPIYQIDAFSDRPFGGNPAAVCPLESWRDDATLQAIAAENNLAETAFFVPDGERYQLRWFTPEIEVALCGHATLAAAYVILERLQPGRRQVAFETQSGTLTVARDGARLVMDFPAIASQAAEVPKDVVGAVGGRPTETHAVRQVHGANYYMLAYAAAAEVRGLKPDFSALRRLGCNVIATAPGDTADFVSRFFAPAAGIDEDPVTGSAHCTLAPYWAKRLGKTSLKARQVSRRGGEVLCTVKGERVLLAGTCAFYMAGEIAV